MALGITTKLQSVLDTHGNCHGHDIFHVLVLARETPIHANRVYSLCSSKLFLDLSESWNSIANAKRK